MDTYIDDFVAKIPDYLDIIDSAWDGWPGIRSPGAKEYLAKHQITAEGWYIAYPDLTVAEILRLRRIGKAVDEFLDKIGYPGETGVPLPMPQPDLLGRNGTYVGLRRYQSRVGAFNRFLQANGKTEAERELLAAKLVGRWRSGAPLTLAPDTDNPALGADPQRNNNFDYANDQHGRQVPFGSHIRRMNPRDTKLTRLTDVNIHRLIRRGTTYGKPYDPNELSVEADETSRGAIFLFISAKAMDTIEFLQKEWVNDGNFIEAGDERDPIIGRQEEGATFTIPKEPVRRRLRGIETFNVLRGGEYFFMPSISALNWLANLISKRFRTCCSTTMCFVWSSSSTRAF